MLDVWSERLPRNRARLFARALLLCSVISCVLLAPRSAYAYTWMLKHGYGGCTTCHADPSGGELLTPYGRAQSDLLLRMRWGHDNVSAQSSQKDSGSSGSFDSFDDDDDEGSSDEGAPKHKPKAKPDKQDKQDATDSTDDEQDPNADADKANGDTDKANAKPDANSEMKAKPEQAEAPAPQADAASAAGGAGSDLSSTSGFLWGLVTPPDWLLLGGSYRHLTLFEFKSNRFATFPMQADLYGQLSFGWLKLGGTIGAIRVPEGSPYARAAQITQNQGDQWNLISRTHYIGFEVGDSVMIRAGRLNLPFGIRIPEHTMWVRSVTRTDRESSQEHGAAIAYNGEALRGELMGIAGNYQINPDKYRERGYSMYLEYLVASRTALGVSSEVTYAKRDRVIAEPGAMLRQAHGAFVRSALGDDTVLLAEADFLNRSFADAGYVGFAQVDFEAVQGLHFMGTGEILDNGFDKRQSKDPKPGNGAPQLGGWGSIDWFFLPHVEFRFDTVIRQSSNVTLLAQLHAFL